MSLLALKPSSFPTQPGGTDRPHFPLRPYSLFQGALQHFRSTPSERHCRSVGVSGNPCRHCRAINHVETFDAVNRKVRPHDRIRVNAHAAGPGAVKPGGDEAIDFFEQTFVRYDVLVEGQLSEQFLPSGERPAPQINPYVASEPDEPVPARPADFVAGLSSYLEPLLGDRIAD